jgi:hypothetical protein
VRAEEKELEGPDLEREQRVEASRREAHEEEQLPEDVTEAVTSTELDHRSRLFDALQLILANEPLNLTLLYLPKRETQALEALQAAVQGSDSMGEFVFAEDRKGLLEQALAVLQQNLTYGDPAQLATLQSKFDSMTQQVGELRAHLVNLEDAQEEIDEFHNAAREMRLGDGDKDDDEKPKPKEDGGLVDFIAEALFAMAEVSPSKTSTLAGEERVVEKPKHSSLTHGPDRKDEKVPSTMFVGPDAVHRPAGPSSLSTGPEKKEAPRSRTTLEGPEIAATPKAPSTLGDGKVEAPRVMEDLSPQRRKILEKPLPEVLPQSPPPPPAPDPKKGKS